ncbi:hypothetical protein [Kitasatospora purpeofusca]|uniref:hypothetical protein n=1 Tax=Kitasatospora purpeofusca TaxID=67352 RepID=UPI0036D2137F
MVGATVYLLALGLPALLALAMLARAVRKATNSGRLRKAIQARGTQPGWRVHHRKEPRWDGHLAHHRWLTDETRAVYTVSGPLGGHPATVALLMRQRPRDVDVWLTVCLRLPQPVRTVRLERPWSAVPQGVRWPAGLFYGPRGEGPEPLADLLLNTDVPRRLAAVGAPAVSFHDHEVCFLWHPAPRGEHLESLLDTVLDALPVLRAAAAR